MRRFISLAALSLCGPTACAVDVRPSTDSMEHVDSAKIRLIRVNRAQDPSRIDVTRSARIGDERIDGDPRATFEYLSDVLPLDDGRIAVIDNRAPRVAVFSASGGWLVDIGRQGSGPGEYRGPIYGDVVGDTIFVWDQLQRRLSAFRDGRYVREIG